MNKMNLSDLQDFYEDHLFTVLVPFWMKNGIDWEMGGYFTCFNNASDTLVSTNKYTWSQGRFLWMLSRLAYSFADYSKDYKFEDYLKAASCGAEFLKEHALLPNGHAAWALDRDGKPIEVDRLGNEQKPGKGIGFEVGVNADLFLIYGMAEYARAANKVEFYEFALTLFESVEHRYETRTYAPSIRPVPQGYQEHSKSMIMLETAQELASIANFFNHPSEKRLKEVATISVQKTLSTFVNTEEQLLFEHVKEDGSFAFDELLGSTVNPGHALEDTWFIMHYGKRFDNEKVLKSGVDLVKWIAGVGIDKEYGGIPQFMHKEGGAPAGIVLDVNKDNQIVKDIKNNWYNKLWWVHSEALYALILAYEHSRDEWFMTKYWELHEYVFKTFPNPNREIGEWIQIRNRAGEPEDKVVALPVKDPYHITRAFMHLIKSLERMNANQ